jgi:ribonuclease D
MQGQFPAPVVGVDCEGLVKDKPIALIQLSFQDHSYIFDLETLNPFDASLEFNLASVLSSPRVIKIFHDFVEDGAALTT